MADNYLDPEEAPVASDTQSSDASTPKYQKLWNAWSSKPENNAALLQFGIAMLQPRGTGQSGIGSVANAIGEGAEASNRNVAQQQAEQQRESTQALEEAKTAATTSNAASTRINANAFSRSVDQTGAGSGKGLTGIMRQQADFRKWLARPEDATGLTADPILMAVQKIFPNIKTKGDLLADPPARAAAQKLFTAQITTEPADEDSGSPPAPSAQPAQSGAAATPSVPTPSAAPAPAASAPQPRIIYQQGTGKPFWWDGVPGHQPTPYNTHPPT